MEYKTKQKDSILQLFIENKELSLSAKDIKKLLGDSVSKATLYRSLDRLIEDKTIRKYYNELTSNYEYQYASKDDSCTNHLHLKCTSCGKLIHLHCLESNSFLSHITKKHNFCINQEDTIIYGLCSSCSIIKRG